MKINYPMQYYNFITNPRWRYFSKANISKAVHYRNEVTIGH